MTIQEHRLYPCERCDRMALDDVGGQPHACVSLDRIVGIMSGLVPDEQSERVSTAASFLLRPKGDHVEWEIGFAEGTGMRLSGGWQSDAQKALALAQAQAKSLEADIRLEERTRMDEWRRSQQKWLAEQRPKWEERAKQEGRKAERKRLMKLSRGELLEEWERAARSSKTTKDGV